VPAGLCNLSLFFEYKLGRLVLKDKTRTFPTTGVYKYEPFDMPGISIMARGSDHLPSPQCIQPTNSLVITQVPRSFFQPLILNVLRDHFATYGEINQWVPIASFSRIILVYHSEDSAELAKHACDPLVLAPPHRFVLLYEKFDILFHYLLQNAHDSTSISL
jgi:hypothetical protein